MVAAIESPAVNESIVHPIAGEAFETGKVLIDAEGTLSGEGVPTNLSLDEVRMIEFATTGSTTAGQYEVRFRGGSSLFVRNLTLGEEQCKFDHGGQKFEFPIESIAAVRLDTSEGSDLFDNGVAEPLSEYDKIYIRIENQLQAVTGVIDSVGGGKVSFLFDDSPRELNLKQVYGFVVADFGAEAPPTGNATVTLSEGSVLKGSIAELSETNLVMVVGDEVQLTLDRASLQSIKVKSDRLAFLSDLEPISSEVRPIVTARRDWQRDLSVDGNPLTLSISDSETPREFKKGIGTHAETRIDFSNADGFDRFASLIGIDSETDGRGDCEFVVLGDDRELLVKQMTGKDEPFEVDLDISGVQVVTLLVRAGNQLDLADHANWCEARFLRTGAGANNSVGQ